MGRRHAVAQPAALAQAAYPVAAGGAVVGLVDLLLPGPFHQSVGQHAVGVIEEGQFQMGAGDQAAVGMGVFEADHVRTPGGPRQGLPGAANALRDARGGGGAWLQSPSKTGRCRAAKAS